MTTVSASEFLELWLMQSTSSYICLPSSKAYFGTKADIHSENVIRAASRNTFVLAEDHLNKHGPQPELSFFLLRLHHKPGMDKDQTNVFYFSLLFFFFTFSPSSSYNFLFYFESNILNKSRYYTSLYLFFLSFTPKFVAAPHSWSFPSFMSDPIQPSSSLWDIFVLIFFLFSFALPLFLINLVYSSIWSFLICVIANLFCHLLRESWIEKNSNVSQSNINCTEKLNLLLIYFNWPQDDVV